jgi:hypothetical protein
MAVWTTTGRPCKRLPRGTEWDSRSFQVSASAAYCHNDQMCQVLEAGMNLSDIVRLPVVSWEPYDSRLLDADRTSCRAGELPQPCAGSNTGGPSPTHRDQPQVSGDRGNCHSRWRIIICRSYPCSPQKKGMLTVCQYVLWHYIMPEKGGTKASPAARGNDRVLNVQCYR